MFKLAGFNLVLDPAATLENGWFCLATGPGLIDPNDGSDVRLMADEWALIISSGTATSIFKAQRGPTSIVKISDETTNTDTTLSDDAVLKFPVIANTKYWFEFTIHYDTPTAADFKYDINGPAAPTLLDIVTRSLAPGATADVITRQTAFAFTSLVITETSGTRGFIRISGLLHNGANAGTVVFRWAQNTSNGSNTTVRASSRVDFGIAQ